MSFFNYEEPENSFPIENDSPAVPRPTPVKISPWEPFSKLVHSRRAERFFDGRLIPAEAIQKSLELALLSPNSSNLQPWEFYWVREPEKKQILAKLCLNQYTARQASDLIVCVGRIDTWKKNQALILKHFAGSTTPPRLSQINYFKILVPVIYERGFLGLKGFIKKVIKTLVGFTRAVTREPFSKTDMQVWAAKNSSLAAQTFMLAIHAAGYDSCPMEGIDSRQIKKLFQIPQGNVVTMVIAVGQKSITSIESERLRFKPDLFIKAFL